MLLLHHFKLLKGSRPLLCDDELACSWFACALAAVICSAVPQVFAGGSRRCMPSPWSTLDGYVCGMYGKDGNAYHMILEDTDSPNVCSAMIARLGCSSASPPCGQVDCDTAAVSCDEVQPA